VGETAANTAAVFHFCKDQPAMMSAFLLQKFSIQGMTSITNSQLCAAEGSIADRSGGESHASKGRACVAAAAVPARRGERMHVDHHMADVDAVRNAARAPSIAPSRRHGEFRHRERRRIGIALDAAEGAG